MTELANCWSCGSAAEVVTHPSMSGNSLKRYSIRCVGDDEYCLGKHLAVDYRSIDNAIAAWNRRAPDLAVEALIALPNDIISYLDEMEDPEARRLATAIRRARAAYQALAGAGEVVGWKLVPVEPTEEMLQAADAHESFAPDDWDRYRETYRAMLAAAPSAPSERYRHRKRGSTYVKIGNAHLQTSTPLEDMAVLIVYRSEANGALWVRSAAEFFDGRFETLSAPSALNGVEAMSRNPALVLGALDELRSEEASSVTLLCDNPDFNGQPNCAIVCNGDWTGYEDRRFTGDTIAEAIYAALSAYQAAPEATEREK